MRILRALPTVLVIGGCLLGAVPAAAADSPVTITLAQRWNAGQPGGWTPYVATIQNDSAADFSGDVTLHPVEVTRGPSVQSWPDYHARVTVPHGAQRSVTFYVVEPPAGYQASLADASGHVIASGVTAGSRAEGSYTIAVLSDQPQAGSRIEALKPLASNGAFGASPGLRASRFGSAQDFPGNAVFLSGLSAVVVDDFDVSTLSDAQLRALRDFVGLGGSLVAAGGASWRRTLLPLAQKGFAGLNPSRSGEAALQPLADLANQATTVTAPIAVGDIVGGRTLLGAPGRAPLVVEAAYGAGRIIDLAYDPLAEPLASDGSGLEALAWTLALDRAVLDVPTAGNRGVQPPTPAFGAGNSFQVNVNGQGNNGAADEIVNILQNTPAAAVPPIGLLGALLVVYVMLAGPLNYVAARGLGRRELMWVSVPLVALLFTSAAYIAGSAVHGAAYFDNEVQVLRLGPDGVAEVHAYHGVYPPHRGNFTVDVAANTLASTSLGTGQNTSTPETAVVNSGSHAQVELRDTAYGGFRSLQTVAVSRAPLQPSVSIEAHLRVAGDRVVGSVHNTGDRAIEQMKLVGGTGQEAVIAAGLAPRATAAVNAPLSTAGQATPFPERTNYGANSADYKRDILLRVASGTAVTGRVGDWAIVGLTQPSGALTVAGTRPAHSGLAAVVAPVGMESVDTLGLAPRAALLVAGSQVPYHYDVYDLAVPAGYAGPVKLTYEVGPAGVAVQAVRSIEVYDWDTGGWRSLPPAATGPSVRALTVDLSPGETRGTVRVRVNEQTYLGSSNMRLASS